MLKRDCSGGVVFYRDKVLILKNDKNEWVLPKGVIRGNKLPADVAIERVRKEAGVKANIVSTVGETCYEFFSYSRQKPVCNEISWYLMEATGESYKISEKEGFMDGGFYYIDEAVDMITYSQDKSIVRLAYKRYLKSKGVVYLSDYRKLCQDKSSKKATNHI